ncbi:MAG: Rieske (2Fe-2S) protein, partial [Pseudomonadota bacterium]
MTERETAPPSTEPTADAEAVEPMGEIGTPLPRPTVPRPTPEQPATGNPALEPATDEPWVTGQWYVALPSAALRPGRMLARILFGQPVLLARRRDGSVFALRDLCPHRGIPLSAGRFDGETVACGYHGWRFDGEGRCTLIPSLAEQSQVDTGRVRTGAWRVVERQGLIWI